VGDASLLRDLVSVASINPIMAPQFLTEIEAVIGGLAAALEPAGHVIFTAHHLAAFYGSALHFSMGVEVYRFLAGAQVWPLPVGRSANNHPICLNSGRLRDSGYKRRIPQKPRRFPYQYPFIYQRLITC
jgi:hypothetical protein